MPALPIPPHDVDVDVRDGEILRSLIRSDNRHRYGCRLAAMVIELQEGDRLGGIPHRRTRPPPASHKASGDK